MKAVQRPHYSQSAYLVACNLRFPFFHDLGHLSLRVAATPAPTIITLESVSSVLIHNVRDILTLVKLVAHLGDSV